MDKIAVLPRKDREDIFRETAAHYGMSASVAEKDFWVCWTLRRLFSCPEIAPHIIFKGGTCLAKVFKLIERFSEDIDLILNWKILTGEDPRAERSNSKQQQFNEKLETRAMQYIREVLQPLVSELVSPVCTATVDPNDGHVLRINYQATFENDYVLPYIKLEIGPLAAWHPHELYRIKPYAAEIFPDLFSYPETELRAIKAERIFWEKVTILHSEAHRPQQSRMPARYSRHYYDVYKLAQSAVKDSAFTEPALLKEVAVFKRKFYYCNWAKYDQAQPGSITLYPPQHVFNHLAADYKEMRVMIYGDYPEFTSMMNAIQMLENEINKLSSC